MLSQRSQIFLYESPAGKIPLKIWLDALSSPQARGRIRAKIDRVQFGIEGDWKSLGSGLYEFRIHVGPGYRIYFMRLNSTAWMLLCGGDKNSQNRDIKNARMYLAEYRSRGSQ